jgi:pimeloyl-ACP methyl ester carboxylesterase
MLREGSGESIVLLHGVMNSEAIWSGVVPLLATRYDTIAPTALGHRGGRSPIRRPVRIADVVDDAEASLDELGLKTAHLAGNSMGGWVALELARRGRARSVCALSPAGVWEPGTAAHSRSRRALRATLRLTRLGRPVLPLLADSARFRRRALRLNVVHGDRVSASALVALADDALACGVALDLLSTTELLERLDPTPCPITIAWAQRDRVLPLALDGARARKLVPGARFLVLEDVGHVPMLEDPELVARTLHEAISAAASV